MWEILEDKLPYVKLSNPEVFNFIANEKGTLPIPTRVEPPKEIWNMIQRCWTFDPDQRPSFDELNKELRSIDEEDETVSSFGKEGEADLELKKISSFGIQYENSISNYVRRSIPEGQSHAQTDETAPLEKSPTVYGNQFKVEDTNNVEQQ